MWAARATGMKVRRYFVGFGPTLWSTRRPNKLGETEYGVKAIPLGGFCDIAGMTAIDELAPDERPYAMYKQKTWKRVAVLFAGPGHELRHRPGAHLRHRHHLGTAQPAPAHHRDRRRNRLCRTGSHARASSGDCIGPSPAAIAGIRPGDTVVKVGDTDVANFDEMVAAVRKLDGPTPFVVRARRRREFTTIGRRHPDAALGRQ